MTAGTVPFETYMRERVEWVERALRESLPAEWDMPERLREAMNYSLLAGGKRMRPLMVLAAAESLDESVRSREAAIAVACGIEMAHTYSLIHDDLPAMDNDDFRRGRPTNHKVFGEAMAILAGDALLTHAFHAIVQAHRRYGLSAADTLAIVEELSAYAGAKGMVGGQAADLMGEQGITRLEELEYIHVHKTSDLIVCSLRAGGRIGGATPEQLDALARFGRAIGLAFQIQDDVLDVIGDERKLGKSRGSDEKGRKVTYPFFIGLEASQSKVRELTEAGKASIAGAGFRNPKRLLEIADFLMNRDH